jgi:hypothetical protein
VFPRRCRYCAVARAGVKDARLIGIVSRRDLLAVFLRPDEDIAADVRQVFDEILLTEPGEADVAVRDGPKTQAAIRAFQQASRLSSAASRWTALPAR